MSITVTTDIDCDYENCNNWEFGTVGTKQNTKEARKKVAKIGWTRCRVMGDLMDLCPDCTNLVDAYYKAKERTVR